MTKQHHPAYRGPWSTVRKTILNRDNHQCQIRAPKCTGIATQVDHIIPITKGGAWWDPDNLRASCAHCNNQRIDRKQDDRWQTTPTQITLIVGPPGTPKPTTGAQPGDLIIDYDNIADALTIGNGTNPALHQAANTARNAVLRDLRKGRIKTGRAYIISSNPEAERMFPYHKVIVVDPGIEQALENVRRSSGDSSGGRGMSGRAVGDRDGSRGSEALVRRWYQVRSGEPSNQKSSRKW
jgi:hypothetical protein